ncbi:hypothetical protein FISHEDRAFT_78783 [Fistulina hepatica ATCC 64428]|uniref:ER membrane protein complex subunit 6 n=1 Tax=Fistulina hepatica ATCC 64428 TaxID=1128425 RepID=A0A0D7A145_9AGAR|nr:hypothetical protein FISHEDRAFT_78783 [Fistulina hepatica ATCC 64428]
MSSPSSPDATAQLVYQPNLMSTYSSLSSVKFLTACLAGAVTGILGLENWAGFGLFALSTILTSLSIYFINCKGRPYKYILGNTIALVNPGKDNAFTFVLVWTLFYAIVHVYD